MADKSINELMEATQITGADLFLLQQSGSAKKLTGQTLENWLLKMADGHGGIHEVTKTGTIGMVDTYTITFADQSTHTFSLTNGKGVASFTRVSASGLNVTWRMTYNDGSYTDVVISNGAKGDKGDNAYTHFKWASQMPTAASHSMGDIPADYIGVYSGNLATAPNDWTMYKWFQYKGNQGDPGVASQLTSSEIKYAVSSSGTVVPGSAAWQNGVPATPNGYYLWTRTTLAFNTGNPVVFYSASRNGIDGSGAVSTVNGIAPTAGGNVQITAEDIGARPSSWMPTAAQVGARADSWMPTAEQVGAATKRSASLTLTASSWVNQEQRVSAPGVTSSSDVIVSPAPESFSVYAECTVRCISQGSGTLTFKCEDVPTKNLTVSVAIFN